MATFGITSPTELLDKLLEEQADFEKEDCLSSRHAINAIMTAYHLHEWVWGAFVKHRPDLHTAWQLARGRRAKCADFKLWLQPPEHSERDHRGAGTDQPQGLLVRLQAWLFQQQAGEHAEQTGAVFLRV